MGATLKKINLETAAMVLVAVSICSIHFSNAIASLTLMAAIALSIGSNLRAGFSLKSWIWIISAFFVYQFCIEAFFHAQSVQSLLQSFMVKLPLLFGPFLFRLNVSREAMVKIISSIGLFLAWISIAAVLHYGNHKAFYDIMIAESKPLPLYSKVYHIEYSLILSLTTLSLLFSGIKLKTSFIGKANLILAAVLIICLHVLSARTGLLAFYSGFFVLIAIELKKVNLKLKLVSFGLLFLMGLLIFQVPSLKNRILNTKKDLSSVLQGENVNHQSFGQRWVAWNASLQSIKKEPLHGYGINHVKETIDKNYLKEHQSKIEEENKVMPHNVYLESMVQSGVLAGLLYLAFLALGIFWSYLKNKPALAIILIALLSASIFETITERQAGVIAIVGFIALAGSLKPVEQKG